VQGFAGTGKSHMLDTAKAMIEGEGYTVRALAPYGSQVKALRELGAEANTLAPFLKAKDKNIDGRTVLVIDEAGVMPTRLTRNDAALDVANGDRFKVAKVEPGKLTIEGAGRRIELPANKPMHLDLAYATTVHSAQSLTSDRVLIEAQINSRTTAKDVYYVAISRARQEARIYTNDRGKLPAAIARDNRKHAALHLERERQGRDRGTDLQKPGAQRQEREATRA
jgi:ATP-dependent exoDNAse (exonuclease V) alpha subunit